MDRSYFAIVTDHGHDRANRVVGAFTRQEANDYITAQRTAHAIVGAYVAGDAYCQQHFLDLPVTFVH